MTNTITNIRREFIDDAAALVFDLGGEQNCEWLDKDDHNMLTDSDSHLITNFSHLELDGVFEQLNEWLEENPVKIEWSENNGFHGGFMDGGSYYTLTEAEAALEGVKAEFFAQCGTDEDRVTLESGEFRILW